MTSRLSFPVGSARRLLLLVSFSNQQTRSASILGSLSDVRSAYNRRIRLGRGASSGKGKTSGRGQKGQKARSKVPVGFNGGQTKDEVVHGTRGFENAFAAELSPINLDRIQEWIDCGRLDPSKPITLKELQESKCLHGIKKDGVKLLARGSEKLHTPIKVVASRASVAAIEAVEKSGGTVVTRYYTGPSIKRILKGETDPIFSRLFPEESGFGTPTTQYKYSLPDPAGREHLEYYRDPAHRGYLSYTIQDGNGPSLYFKPQIAAARRNAAAAKKTQQKNRLW